LKAAQTLSREYLFQGWDYSSKGFDCFCGCAFGGHTERSNYPSSPAIVSTMTLLRVLSEQNKTDH